MDVGGCWWMLVDVGGCWWMLVDVGGLGSLAAAPKCLVLAVLEDTGLKLSYSSTCSIQFPY